MILDWIKLFLIELLVEIGHVLVVGLALTLGTYVLGWKIPLIKCVGIAIIYITLLTTKREYLNRK